MALPVIGLDHFSAGRNLTPTPDDAVDDLAKLLREQQQDVSQFDDTITDAESPYDALATDGVIGVDTTSAVATVNLPLAASVPKGKRITVQDVGGDASSNAITIAASGADTLNGVSSISTDYGRAEAISDGAADWYCA